jgi:hypothetical protein
VEGKTMRVEQLSYKIGCDDPAKIIMDRLGNSLDKLPNVYGSRVLLATAPSPSQVGSIILIDKTREEGRFQGKCGLILKLGPSAFKYDPQYPNYPWEGHRPEIGDWVFFRNSDSYEIGINGISCRYIMDDKIVGNITDIEMIW